MIFTVLCDGMHVYKTGLRTILSSKRAGYSHPVETKLHSSPLLLAERLTGLVVTVSALRAEDPEFESRLRRVLSRSSHTSDLKTVFQWLHCQAPGITGSTLGLVGPVSVYCNWVRWKGWPVTIISVWQHVQLSEQTRPWDTVACCWDVKQPTHQLSLANEVSIA